MADQPVGEDETNFSEILGETQKPADIKVVKLEAKSSKTEKRKGSKPDPNQKIVVTIVHKTQPEPEAKPESKARPKTEPKRETRPEPKVEPKQEAKTAPAQEVKKTTTTTTTYVQEQEKPATEKTEKKKEAEKPAVQLVQMVRTDAPDPYECPNCQIICLEDKVPCCVKACMVLAGLFMFPLGLFFLFGLKCKRKECPRCGYKEKKSFTCFYVCFVLFFVVPYILGSIALIVLITLILLGII